MLSKINKLADKLLEAGIVPCERIAFLSGSCPEYAALVLACWKIFAVTVPISTRYPASMINASLENVGCKKIFISSDYTNHKFKVRSYRIDDFINMGKRDFTPLAFDSLDLNMDADASIIFTSASSGASKAVLHSIANHYYSAKGANKNIPFEKDDRWLMSLPMYHISGFSLLMRALLNQGTIVFPVSSASLKETILSSRASHISIVPAQLSILLDDQKYIEKLKKYKAILLGGSAIPQTLIEKSIAMDLPIYTTYGSTEMASQITTTGTGDVKNTKVTSGKLLEHRQLKIDADGEILVKGRTLFRGYVTADSTHIDLDEQGYFHSADIGYIDNDNLFVIGRKDLMFISGGENIYPEEIERALAGIENVEQTIVVPVDDQTLGQRPVAFIKTKENKLFNADDIKATLRKKIEGFKVPITLLPWPKIEDSSIKPDRKAFRDYAARQNFTEDC
jgi:O-succinylbenzoic acid--CoA ligase